MNTEHRKHLFDKANAWPAQARTVLARSSVAGVLLLLMLLLVACNPASLTGLTVAQSPTTTAPTTEAFNQATPTPAAPATGSTSAPILTPAASPTVASTAPVVAASTSTAAGTPAPGAVADAIKKVIQRANEEEVQAFASKDPSVMADTATSDYYQQMAQSYNDMANSGVTAVQLAKLVFGAITLQNANTAQANTTETWVTTFSDGSTMQETDPNVYTLVLQGGSWKVQDDQHPNTRTMQTPPPASGTPGVAPTAIASAVPGGTGVEQSSNWAGYTASGGTFTAVSGTWTVPNVSAGTGNSVAADATWVGIGGVNTTDLIQAGTQAVVQSGQVVYSAWWETLPQAAQTVPLDVSAGDNVGVTITQQPDGTWQISIRDDTSGQSFQKSLTYQSSRSSAEWIEESPTAGRRTLLPLDDFGTVTFTKGMTVQNGQQHTIAQANGQPITMFSSTTPGRRGRPSGQPGQPLAQPSALGADGASFSVTRTNVPAPSVVP